MKKALLICLSYYVSTFLLSGCTENDPIDPIENNEINKVAVKKVNVLPIKNINIGNRNNYQTFVEAKMYNYRINGNRSLTIIPDKDTFYFEYQGDISNAPISSVYVFYSSKIYCDQFGLRFSDFGLNIVPLLPNTFDQLSIEALVNADLLFGKYKGPIVSGISDVKLTHANALLEFDVTGLKRSDTIYINDLKTSFKPYTSGNGNYKAIVTGEWIRMEMRSGNPDILPPVKIEVRTLNNKYIAKLPNGFYPVRSNTKYKFDLIIHHSNNTLSITDTSRSIWSNELFPSN